MDGRLLPPKRFRLGRPLLRSVDCAFETLSYAPAKHFSWLLEIRFLEERKESIPWYRSRLLARMDSFPQLPNPGSQSASMDRLHATCSFVAPLFRASMALTLFTNAFSRTPLPIVPTTKPSRSPLRFLP